MAHTQGEFIKGYSTQHNIIELIKDLNNGKEALFIDLKSAFDQVIRSKLYDIQREKEIISSREL